MKAIQDGWETKGYKCNPMIIPFTGTIWAGTPEAEGDHTKRTAEANFADCVKNLTNTIFFKHHISPNHPETPKRIKEEWFNNI